MGPEQIEALRTQLESQLKAQYLCGLSVGFRTCATAVLSLIKPQPVTGEAPAAAHVSSPDAQQMLDKIVIYCNQHLDTLAGTMPGAVATNAEDT